MIKVGYTNWLFPSTISIGKSPQEREREEEKRDNE